MKRICFLVDSIFSIGGVQRVTAVIAKALAADNDVTIVTFDSPKAKDTSLYGLDQSAVGFRFVAYPRISPLHAILCKAYSAGYRKLRLPGRWPSDLYARSSFPKPLRTALTEELRAGHYDIIVGVHAPLASRLATIRPGLGKVRCIGWIHNSFEALFDTTSLYIGADRKRHYVYQFMKLDATIVLCRHDAEAYTHYDARMKPTVIYNPLTLTPGKPSSGTSRKFLAVGRFSRLHKGFDLLIDAFHLFAKKNEEWTLDIVGEGPEEMLYRRKIADYGLEHRIALHPFTNHIQDYYSQAQIYVLSSRWEGFGLVLVEAMAHGLPIVTSDLPTSKELLGDFGLYFKNGDASDLARRLQAATTIDWPAASVRAIQIAGKFELQHIAGQWKALMRLSAPS